MILRKCRRSTGSAAAGNSPVSQGAHSSACKNSSTLRQSCGVWHFRFGFSDFTAPHRASTCRYITSSSAVTCCAIHHLHRALDSEGPQSLVVCSPLPIWRRLPSQVKNLRTRPEKLGWVSVTADAPLHVKRLVFPGDRHLADIAVTSGTADSFADVNAVVEVDKIRQIVHSPPPQRF